MTIQLTTQTDSPIDLKDYKLPNNRRIFGFTDNTKSHMCGVTHSIKNLKRVLENAGNEVQISFAHDLQSWPLGGTKVRLETSRSLMRKAFKDLEKFQPDHVHIFTEGPRGFFAKDFLTDNGIPHTSSFHTLWPEYTQEFLTQHYYEFGDRPLLDTWYGALQGFHSSSETTMTRSSFMLNQLANRGFKNLALWNGGVDVAKFSPEGELHKGLLELKKRTKKPIVLYVGRISEEKNIEVAINATEDQNLILIGAKTPYKKALKNQYEGKNGTQFYGKVEHSDLAKIYRTADVLIFPSLTDTFGLVNVEALACGTPIIYFSGTCVDDIVVNGTGVAVNLPPLGDFIKKVKGKDTLKEKKQKALQDREKYMIDALRKSLPDAIDLAKSEATAANCAARAACFSQENVTKQFMTNLADANVKKPLI